MPEAKTKRVLIRMTPAMLRAIEAEATRRGQYVPEWIRNTLDLALARLERGGQP